MWPVQHFGTSNEAFLLRCSMSVQGGTLHGQSILYVRPGWRSVWPPHHCGQTTAQRICGTVFRNELQSGTWETREGRVCVTVERKAAPTVQQPPFANRVCETVDKNGLKSTTRGTGEGRVCVTVAEKVAPWGPGKKAFRLQAPTPPHTPIAPRAHA